VQSLLAIDVRSGKWRRVGDFVGSGMGVLEHVAPDLAIVGVSSPLYNWSVEYPVGGHENPLSGNAVYLVDLVSGERLRLRPLDFYAVLRPSLSPDRRLLAFDGYDHHAKKSGAFVLNIETLQVKPLPFHAVNFSWSSDSRWVATARWENKQPPEVVLIDAITGQIRKTAFRGTLPRFTPNGRQLAFQTTLTKTWPHRPASLSIADFPDGKPKEVLHLQDAHLEEYSFSPDGNRVLYWQSPVGQYQDYGTKSLHDLDLRSGKSRPILTLQ
jgi:dipeptidyl aminopeptidase/acylaminoacyl peptidase